MEGDRVPLQDRGGTANPAVKGSRLSQLRGKQLAPTPARGSYAGPSRWSAAVSHGRSATPCDLKDSAWTLKFYPFDHPVGSFFFLSFFLLIYSL